MKKASPDSDSLTDRIFSLARSKAHGPAPSSTNKSQDSNVEQKTSSPSSQFPVTNDPAAHNNALHSQQHASSNIPPFPSTNADGLKRQPSKPTHNQTSDTSSTDNPPPAPPPQVDGSGNIIENGGDGDGDKNEKPNVMMRFWITMKTIVLSSYINLLLVFVPVGIVAKAVNLAPGAIFGLNAIAIVPLAGLLSHATESVAKRMGDTVGALMNVTFGNAVELIIFIALQKNEIRIVQASLLGSILANLLLILGMCFLVGGLRFREQIYNSTVTQMSACLLSLAVMSLLLPTAFHASFSTASVDKANSAVLKVSRGTSVILLLVYGFYLLFQLKSHAYMYESTPQHIIDEELAPGPVAAWMDTSSDDSSSSSSDSDSSSGSNNTAKRIKRVMRAGRRRRKSSAGSKDGHEAPIRTPSIGTSSITPVATDNLTEEPEHASFGHRLGAIDFGEEGGDEAPARRSRKNSYTGSHILSKKALKKERKREEKRAKKERKAARRNAHNAIAEGVVSNGSGLNEKEPEGLNDPRRVDFAVNGNGNINEDLEAQTTPGMGDASPLPKRNIFGSIRPQIPKTFSQNVFTSPGQSATPPLPTGPVPRVRYGIRRTNSLPDRLNQTFSASGPGRNLPPGQLSKTVSQPPIAPPEDIAEEENISRTTAVVLLLISTGLVAVCAEFMVDSINAVVSGNSGLSEAFVGLIILPIVGNAAEHVTAVTVASKNKMDLAIGVAVGSSIQIALFVTPFIVLLGWCMSKDMTLYFTLFETVSLFVSAFIVNFLVLDGRSNYLEGALLCAAYIIIAVAAFFYPAIGDSSNLGGNADAAKMKRDLVASVLAPIFGTSGM